MTDPNQPVPHLRLFELYNDGMLHEIAVVKVDRNGDLYFIRIDELDQIDRDRLRTILLRRDAAKYALWDLLDQRTLQNGMNALEYFHQYVMARAASGKIFRPTPGKMGVGIKKADLEKAIAEKRKAAKEAASADSAE